MLYKTLFALGSSRDVKTAVAPLKLEAGCDNDTLDKLVAALCRFMSKHRKHEERKKSKQSAERWTAGDVAMFLVARMCHHIESLRSGAKHQSLKEVLPRPRACRKLNDNVPSVPGLPQKGSLLFKDADRFSARTITTSLPDNGKSFLVHAGRGSETAHQLRRPFRRRVDGERVLDALVVHYNATLRGADPVQPALVRRCPRLASARHQRRVGRHLLLAQGM